MHVQVVALDDWLDVNMYCFMSSRTHPGAMWLVFALAAIPSRSALAVDARTAVEFVPTSGLVSFWDFPEPSAPFTATLGLERNRLDEESFNATTRRWTSGNPVAKVRDTPPGEPFGPLSVSIVENQMLRVRDTPGRLLDIRGDNKTLSLVAWTRLDRKYDNASWHDFGHLAGIWAEPIEVRTYVMFLPQASRGRTEFPGTHVDAEISRTGATMQPACRWSDSYALGAAPLSSAVWHMVAMTFDGGAIRAFVNGSLDHRPPRKLDPGTDCNETWQNPAPISTWTERGRGEWGPGGAPRSNNRSDFTVGGQVGCANGDVCPGSGLGHDFTGLLAALGVWNRALTSAELEAMAQATGMVPLSV
eukprot:m.14212 g.14212  ORF g.14212 m.14212 type:complete len:360 (+) comp10044_c0_seq1:89-1168(+)